MLVVVLAFQLWRSIRLEAELRDTELERSVLLGERILQRAILSETVFASLPADLRLELRGGHVVVDDRIAWLRAEDADADEDLVVKDRLDRAVRAEFVVKDHDAVVQEFDVLLAGPLVRARRLQVLAAAAWHARRAGLPEREGRLSSNLGEVLAEVSPSELASPTVAAAVAAAARLSAGVMSMEARQSLLPALPPVMFAGLELPGDGLIRTISQTLGMMHVSMRQCRDCAFAVEQHLAQGNGKLIAGLQALTADQLLWLMPPRDGLQRAAVVTPRLWFSVAQSELLRGRTFEWPERIEPEFGAADEVRCAGVPGISRLVSATTGPQSSVWMLPVLTSLLVVAFALAFVQQRRAARREADAMAVQSQFLTTVTHELKTPLAGIRLLGEMLAEGRAQGRESDYYHLLVGESARLSLLIDNVLDLGRLERGERSYVLTDVPLAELVRETLRMFAPVLEQGGLQVAFDDGGIVGNACIDRDAFVQALVAVLDNARKYGAAGKSVAVAVAESEAGFMVSVRDHGPGVDAAERESVFDRFVRGKEHQHGSTPGVGIGLYLARSIARRIGGDLICIAPVECPFEGNGAEFRFTLQKGTVA